MKSGLQDVVLAKDFGAVPNDPADQAEALRKAVAYAAANGKSCVLLEPGNYFLHSFVVDKQAARKEWGQRHLWLQEIHGLTLEGAVDQDGNPASALIGCHKGENEVYLPAILWAERCNSLQLRNLKFSREPAYSSAGVIVDKGENYLVVEVFEGNPCIDGMACYCANRFDLKAGALVGESVTYGQGAGVNWRRVEGGEGRRLRLDSAAAAKQVALGEGLSWHFGANTEFQLQFKECRDLQLDNMHTVSSNGFAMQTECCDGVKASRVRFRPEGKLLFTAPRDAWKIYKCEGDFEIEQMVVEGVRMDGQNMHSTFLLVDEVIDRHRLRLWAKWSYAPLRAETGMTFYSGDERLQGKLRSWSADGQGNGGHYYLVELEEPLDLPQLKEAHAVPSCWELNSYTIRHSEFLNIAGCGHIVKYSQVTIEDVSYRNLMNAGIWIGAEWSEFYEGGHPQGITIRRCSFDNCGYTPRCGVTGGIGIRTEGLKGVYNRDIVIDDCAFQRVPVGVDVHQAEGVRLVHNHFHDNVEQPYRINPDTARRIVIERE
ncbi:hypothetical protein EBB07_09060 [Paenibacillaceae bacterium]|nr:hypothetical protein EBB07_09060 [Paenibacillaceae bacterium]